ncbi:MAG: hypothetical protein QM770_14475 [Tepidisphaeraceae bacterium]
MPQRKGGRARRFQPREFPVSETIVAEEARRLAREIDDACLRSTADLTAEITSLNQRCRNEWGTLTDRINRTKERDAAAMRRCLLRDMLLLFKAYAAAAVDVEPAAVTQPSAPERPFCEWLFGNP